MENLAVIIEKKMMELIMNPNKDNANKYIGLYLKDRGWVMNDADNLVLFQFKDPLTGMYHRADVAYLIQGERDIIELIHAQNK